MSQALDANENIGQHENVENIDERDSKIFPFNILQSKVKEKENEREVLKEKEIQKEKEISNEIVQPPVEKFTEKLAHISLNLSKFEYNMNHKHRGLCMIFNHRYFDAGYLSERKGTEADGNQVKETFQKLGFDVRVYEDFTVPEIKSILRAAARMDHSNSDCLVCFVMTHGEQNFLWAKDEKYYVETLFAFFKADNCITLAGKPKLFFIQACRGDQLDSGVKLKVKDVPDSSVVYTIPTWADFLITYSTVPGYYSWRNTLKGSWYIQSLTSVLSQEVYNTPFMELLTKVNYKVAYEYESAVPEDVKYNKQKQVPAINSMLTRKLVFTPK